MTRDELFQRLLPIFGAIDDEQAASQMADVLAALFAEARDNEIHRKLDRLIGLVEKTLTQENRIMATQAQLKQVADSLQANLAALQARLDAAIAAASASNVDDATVAELQAVSDGMNAFHAAVPAAVTTGDASSVPPPIAAPANPPQP